MAAKTGTKSPKKAVVVKKTMATKNPKPTKAQKFATTNLDSALVQKAVDAVLKYHEKKLDGASDKLVLLGDDRPVQVQLTLLRAPGKSQPKPAQLLIPNAFYKLADKSGNDSDDDDDDDDDDAEEPEICLIVKDESKPYCQEMIEKFPDHMGCVKKVLTLDSLRKKHSSYEQKRELLSKYNMFLADDRILPMMSKALGKGFIKAKKLPVPVDVTRQTALPFAIQKALSATYMTVNTGTCISIKAGHTGMDSKKLTENVLAIAKAAATKIPHSWANIQMIGVKTADSVSLPVYNKTPEALREIAKLAGVETKAPKEEASEKKPEKTKKKDLKSPLLAALKKQKKEGEQEAKKTKEEKKKKEPKTTETKAKRSSESTEPASSPQKKQKKEEPVAVEETKEKKVFVSAKKFKGAKKGYIFQMGTKGLGYYIDNVPKVDKMALQAIQRMGGAGGRGAKKAGKRRGRR